MMRKIFKVLKTHSDGVRSVKVDFPDGVPARSGALTDDERRMIAETKAAYDRMWPWGAP